MIDRRLPIERMIDSACGFNPLAPREGQVILRCAACSQERVCARDKSDPKEAVLLVFTCPNCIKCKCPDTPLTYFAADGSQITPSWEAGGPTS